MGLRAAAGPRWLTPELPCRMRLATSPTSERRLRRFSLQEGRLFDQDGKAGQPRQTRNHTAFPHSQPAAAAKLTKTDSRPSEQLVFHCDEAKTLDCIKLHQ